MYITTHSMRRPRLPFYATMLCIMCVLILVANNISLFHNLQSLNSANALQIQTTRVVDRLQYVNVVATDAESSLRGYFLSGSETYLGPYRAAPGELNDALDDLKDLLADSPTQLKNLAQLRTLLARKMGLLSDAVEVYKQGGLGDIVKIAETSESKSMMDEIRLLVVIMVKEQNELLQARSASFYKDSHEAIAIGIGINLCAILVLGLFYKLVRDSYATRVEAERALQHANENLEHMVALRTEQLSVLSRHLISVAETEKARLARELHDEMGANLTAINMYMMSVAAKLKYAQPELVLSLDKARAVLADTVELKRRLIEDLRPSLLDNLGLAAALDAYGKEFAGLSGVSCDILATGEVDVAGPMQAIAVFRIVQESLNNVAKYARARNVTVRVEREGDRIVLEVSDDGIGIAPDAVVKPKSHGLVGMRERALLLGGTFRVERGVNGVGTAIVAEIPLGAMDAAPPPASAPLDLSGLHPAAGGHIPSSLPCSTPPHTLPDLAGQGR
ncbi:MAG: CHASE3 domain-containing protein [Telluria sp.]